MLRFIEFSAAVATVAAFSGIDTNLTGEDRTSDVVCLSGFEAPLPAACADSMEQSPADVSEGAEGIKDAAGTLVEDYAADGMCQVNVHFHLGAEHMSAGAFDVVGEEFMANTWTGSSDAHHRRLAAGAEENPGWFCQGYDADDAKFTTEYHWEYCKDMHVGLTYEIHWPFSTAGSCTGLTDGLGGAFCTSLAPAAIGVQGQVFMIVNDDAYDVEDLAHGMNMTMATTIAKYTGSTTGPSYNNEICSPYAPISWHVDTTCNLVSAKSFDAMCKTMKEYGMSADTHPHGSRDLVIPEWTDSEIEYVAGRK